MGFQVQATGSVLARQLPAGFVAALQGGGPLPGGIR